MDRVEFLSKYGEGIAGAALLTGSLLAFFLCIDVVGRSFVMREGRSTLAWLLLTVANLIYDSSKYPLGNAPRPYVHPAFKVLLKLGSYLPALVLVLSAFHASSVWASQSGFLSSVSVFLRFMDGITVLFVFMYASIGLSSLRRHFSNMNRPSPPASS